jgi:hypothetical protein
LKTTTIILFLLLGFSFYGQNGTISFVRHTENDFVIPKEAKIVYRGMKNEIYIDVPSSESFEVVGIGIIKISKSIYNINPGSGKELIVNIKGILKSGKEFSENKIFEIRNFVGLEAKINDLNLDDFRVRMQKKSLLNAVIKGSFPDKNIGLMCTIKSFALKIPRFKSILVNGNKIDKFYYKKISNKIKVGDEIIISNIRFTVNSNALICRINPILIEIY